MSQEGKQQMKEIAAGQFQAASPMTVISHRFPDSPSAGLAFVKADESREEVSSGTSIGIKVIFWLVVIFILYLIFSTIGKVI